MSFITLPSFIPTDAAIVFLLVAILVGLVGLLCMQMRLRKLCRGKKGADLEDTMTEIHKTIAALQTFEKESKGYYKNIEKRMRRSTQAIDTVRFNAFGGTGLGGNQSFATSILNEDGDGVVVSSLYSRERVSVFAKPVKMFASEIELTEEESRAIALSRARLSGK